MFSSAFVCLFVSRITTKELNLFIFFTKFDGKMAHGLRGENRYILEVTATASELILEWG